MNEKRQDAKTAATPALFAFFTEVGIINQLASALFQKRLPDGVTVAQFSVLNHLIRVRDGQTPLAMARAFQIPKTSLTHSLAGLERRGLVETRANPKDGRSKQVWLTEAGRRFRDAAIESVAGDMAELTRRIDAGDIARVVPVLAEIRQAMDEMRD